jgi:bifunctional ADP-heptose synthase (sugar kinase/adenylyltransferase)
VNKGPNRPVFPDIIRKQMLEALRCVDQVILVANSFQALHLVRPDVYVKGKEYEGKLIKGEVEYCKDHGIEIVFTDQEYSTTKLLNELRRS